MCKEHHVCRFCNKEFRREKTLFAHACVYKLRWSEKSEKPSQVGFVAWKKFFTINSSTNKKKLDFFNFIHSRYYGGFLKFGRFVVDVNILKATEYLDYLMKKSIRLDDWAKDSVYNVFLMQRLNKEKPLDAIIRTIEYVEVWSTQKDELVEDFFIKINPNLFINEVRQGKISPWIIFISERSDRLIERLDESHFKILDGLIDSAMWSIKKKRHSGEIKDIKKILKEYGL